MPEWEVVGKKKKELQLTRKEKKLEEQEFINSAPKLEDVLPHSQVMSLYADLTGNGNNNSTKVKQPNNKDQDKKVQKKAVEKKKKFLHTNPTSEKPRTLEAAIANIKLDELKSNYEIAKVRFDENPLLQLKALTAFLTSKLVVDQNKIVFSGKCLEHPLGLFPDKHQHFLHNVIAEAGKEVRYQFFDTCLLAMVNDLKQGFPISGYKVMLQSLVSNYPDVLYENFDLVTDLIQSYSNPNKMSISTSIMWVVAQAGTHKFKEGLKAWRTFMIAFINLKNYTRYVLDYIKYLFLWHSKEQDVSVAEYLEIMDLLYQTYTISKACQTELQAQSKPLRERTSLQHESQYFSVILEEQIPQSSSSIYRQEMISTLYFLLKAEPQACLKQWRSVYIDNMPESALLLRSIYKDWHKIETNEILPLNEVRYTIETFDLVNQSMYKNKSHSEGLEQCNRLCKTILSKMTVSKSSPLRWIILLSLMALSAFVAYDVSLHGNFQKSQTGRALEQTGILRHYQVFAVRAKVQYANASKWFSKHGPTFLKQAADYIKPYLVLMKNLLIIFSNAVVNGVITLVKYIAVKLPLLHEAIESYCPGITDWVKKSAQNAWQGTVLLAQYLATQGLTYLTLLLQYLRQVLATAFDYLQKNVFVGEYSPENLQKLAVHGASVAQEYVQSSVSWLSHKLTSLATQ